MLIAVKINKTAKGAGGYLCVEVLPAPDIVNTDYATFLVDICEHSEITSNTEVSTRKIAPTSHADTPTGNRSVQQSRSLTGRKRANSGFQ